MKQFQKKTLRDKLGSDERGSLLIFVLVVFSGMILAGGTAIDLSRHETIRASLQYNLDRAVLAAASLRQTQNPSDVVNDYMSKINALASFSITVDADVSPNSRTVRATAAAQMDTWFLNIAGINSLAVSAASAAQEKRPNLEISLVLDVSSVMGENHKLEDMKNAAKDFVSTIMANADADSVTISVVPFNNNVAPSQAMLDSLNVDQAENSSTCLQFEDDDFSHTSIDPEHMQTQGIYTALHGEFDHLDHSSQTCYTDASFQILPYSSNESDLHDKIDSLEASGWTAGQVGMKWGMAMLDPSFRSVTSDMIDNGEMDDGHENSPADYSDDDTMKVIIMMGSSKNSYEFNFGDDYRGPESDLWEVSYNAQEFDHAYKDNSDDDKDDNGHKKSSSSDDSKKDKGHKKSSSSDDDEDDGHSGEESKTSSDESKCHESGWSCVYKEGHEKTAHYLHNPSDDEYFDVDADEWISSEDFEKLNETKPGWTSSKQLDWEAAWGHMSVDWYSEKIGNDDAYVDLVEKSSRKGQEADAAMADACSAARDSGITVFTIGYETDDDASENLQSCASSAGHYYDAEGDGISDTFQSIATSLSKLKLIQ